MALFIGCLLALQHCEAGGIDLKAGDPAPFDGILIPHSELAAVLAKKNRQREEVQIRCDALLEEMQVRLRSAGHEAELLREAMAGCDTQLAAARGRYDGVKRRLGRWRLGLGLLFLKSPERLE